ncbi:InlB B-repeat-containing protein [Oribacterium sp. FC2011]|uniref:InlB B-repeat-containing protein n=1 Tax=Oribacterium sp. FC2011 TaxID=1408311 RepID=UPI0004E251F0|nr:hypothetical protein [Oribacterium sp. FC2011]
MKRITIMLVLLVFATILISCGKPNTDSAETTTQIQTESSSLEDTDISKTVLLKIETEGLGYVAYAEDGETPYFDEEYHAQSGYVNAEPGSHFIISAKAEKGWEFKKWKKDGSDFSTDDQIEIVVDEPVSYIAYFDTEGASEKELTDEQALKAVKNYCYESNPNLLDMEKSGDYTIFWEIESFGDNQIVVLYRSYTGAEIRYYIDSVSGDTYVTEFVKGITDSEQRTDETFNAWDYVDE